MKIKVTGMAAAVLFAISGLEAHAQQMPNPDQLKAEIASIQAKYQPRIDALKAEGEEIGKDLPSKEETIIGFSVGKMHRVDWFVKIPEFSVRQQTWFVKIPEFVMREQHWIVDLPGICMNYVHVFSGGFDIPVPCMKRNDWFVQIPETTMREQKWVLGVPEVTMKEQHWVLDLPEFKVESSQKRIDAAKEKGEAIGQRGQQLAQEMGAEIKAATSQYLHQARAAVTAQFDPPVTMLKAMIASAPDQAKGDLNAKLAEMERARAQALKAIDNQLAAVA